MSTRFMLANLKAQQQERLHGINNHLFKLMITSSRIRVWYFICVRMSIFGKDSNNTLKKDRLELSLRDRNLKSVSNLNFQI